jgi:hypothetical protein
VVISTEKQATTAEGTLYDVKEDDPVAIKFAQGLSRAFPQAALAVPDYATLEQLFRLQAVLLSISARAPVAAERLKLSNFLPSYRYVREKPMPPSLQGLLNYHEAFQTNSHGDAYTVNRYLTTVSGGVSMHLPVRPKSFRLDPGQTLLSFNRQILHARPGPHALSWPAPARGPSVFDSAVMKAVLWILLSLLFLKPLSPQHWSQFDLWQNLSF